MGVVHMLVVALVGITYGWQSDDNGGVEYIVQISPTELKEIHRLGEITSSIDPELVGHVSRIKIRVGTGTLPRETPVHLTAQRSRPNQSGMETASDRMAVPIPQMREQDLAAPIRSLENQNLALIADGSRRTKASMMKPDPDNAGPGFQFPSTLGNTALGNTASDTTAGIRSDLDRAGREISGRGQNMLQDLRNTASDTIRNSLGAPNGTARVPAPGTRQPDPRLQPTMPQFTNGRSATSITGAPTTDPTTTRDQGWSDFARPRLGGPTTDTIGADRTRLNDPRLNDPRSTFGATTASSPSGASNRTSSGTFGQAPGSMTFPPRNATTDPRMSLDRSSQRNDSSNLFTRDRVTSQQQQMELDRQNRTIPSREFATAPTQPDRSQDAFLRNTTGSRTAEVGDRRSGNEPVARVQPDTDVRQGPDRRLTNAELDAGAWSIDRYGRLVDRTGRLITPVAQNDLRRDPRGNLDDRYDNRQPQATLEQPMMNRTTPNLVRDTRQYEPSDLRDTREIPYQQSGVRQPSDTTDFARDPIDRARIVEPNLRREQVRDPISLTNRDASVSGSSATNPIAKTARNHIAAQPLFNGLLLMSFVANIYLMFWLKNLRLRFRDLVAAKRQTGTSNQQS